MLVVNCYIQRGFLNGLSLSLSHEFTVFVVSTAHYANWIDPNPLSCIDQALRVLPSIGPVMPVAVFLIPC